MNRLFRFFLSLFFYVLMFALPVFAQDNADAAKIAEEFFRTFPAKDFEKMPTFWSEKSPERERFLKQFRFSLTDTENVLFKDFVVKGAMLEGDKLTLQVSLTMEATDAKNEAAEVEFRQVESRFAPC